MRRHILSNKWIWGSCISLIAAATAFLISFFPTLESLELKSYDLRFSLRGTQFDAGRHIAIVAIDELSFLDLPDRWPFPRRYYARLIDNLTQTGARLIVLDLLFSEPSANRNDDLELARAIDRSGRVILAGKKQQAANDQYELAAPPIEPIPVLAKAAQAWALVNIDEDVDGFVRRYFPYYEINGRKYLSLAMRSYLSLLEGKIELDHVQPDGGLKIDGKKMAASPESSFLINYRGPARTFPTYSFSNVLDDEDFELAEKELDTDSFARQFLPQGVFKNKVVLVGATAEELQDVKLTPYFSYGGLKNKTPGVEVHANALSTLLRQDAIRRSSLWIDLLIVIIVAAGTMFLSFSGNIFHGLAGVTLLLMLLFITAAFIFRALGIWLPVVAPAIAILLSYAGNSVHVMMTERHERQRIKRVFEHYVSENVVDSILASGQMPAFGGQKLVLTVLFSDIRGFTSFSEKHAPEIVVNRLNEYLTSMVEVIFKHDGTLDKFVGDAIMALYGAPYQFPDHAERACVTACEMIAHLRRLQAQWSEKNEDSFQIGIGINTGVMLTGNLGAEKNFDYTVIGDHVNLGARLESANKAYGTTIIISEYTYRHIRHRARVRELDTVRVKGRHEPVTIYELLSMNPLPAAEEKLLVGVHSRAIRYYKNRQWLACLQQFSRILRRFPNDGPAKLYIARCLDHLESPPPASWNGVHELETK